MRHWRFGITQKLTLVFVLFTSVMLIGLGILAYANGRASLVSAIQSELVSKAVDEKAAFNSWVDERLSRVIALANTPSLIANLDALTSASPNSTETQTAHDSLVRDLLPRTGSGQPFLSLLILEPQKAQVIASSDPEEEGKFRESLPYFINGLTAPYVQNVYYSSEVGGPAMTVSAPIRAPDGRLLGVLAGRLNLEEMNAIIQRRTGLRQTDDTFLVNTSNLFVTQPRLLSDPAILQHGIHTNAVNQCLAHTSGVVSALDYRGVPAIISYNWLPEREVCLIVKMDEAEALAPAQAFGRILLLIGGLILVTASVISTGLARMFTKPILTLQETTAQFGRGELSARAAVSGNDELAALAREFNQMAESLSERDTQLKLRLERIYNQTSNLFVVANFDGFFVDLNPAWTEILGYTTQELMSHPYLDFVHPDDRSSTRIRDSSIIHGTAEARGVNRYRHKNGSYRWLQWNSTSNTQEQLIYGVAQDITAQKEAEQLLRASEAELRALFSAMPDVILVLNAEGRYLKIAPTGTDLLYKPGEELLGKTMGEVLPFELKEKFLGWIQSALQSGETARGDYSLPINGQILHFSASVSPMTEDTVVWVARDITERKQAEDQVKETSAILAERTKLLDLTTSFAFNMRDEIILWSSGMEKLYGWSREEAIGSIAHDFLHTEFQRPYKEIEFILMHDGHWEGELVHLKKDGMQITVACSWELLRDENGDPIAVLEAITDISQRRQAEESTRQQAALLDLANDAILVRNMKSEIVFWSRGAEETYDWTKDQALGQVTHSFLQTLFPDSREAVDIALLTQGRWEGELTHTRRDGSQIIVTSRQVVQNNENGQAIRILEINRDITENKRAEINLHESEERFRAAFEQAAVGIAHVSTEGSFRRLNQRFCDIVGYTQQEVLNLTFQDITHPDDLNADLENVKSVLADKIKTYSMEKRYIHKDGNLVWINLTVSLVREPSGEPKYFISVVEDITARKQAEILLRESRQTLALATQSAHMGIWEWDVVANKLIWDAQMYALYGIREQDFGGAYEAWQNGLHPEDRKRGDTEIVAALEGHKDFDTEFRVVWPGGQVRTLEAHAVIQRAPDGSPLRMIGVNWDVTDRKQAEEEIRTLNVGLEKRVQLRTAELEAANKELEAFSYSISHDLRAPLRAIDGFSRILLEDYAAQLPAESKRYLDIVRQNTQQMGELVDDLLAFSRLSRQPVNKQIIAPADLVQRALTELQPEQKGRTVEIVIGELPECKGDPALLKQVFVNLLANALKYTRKKEAARIEVGCKKMEDDQVYFVKDNGVGFDMQYVGKLFGVFQRLHRAEDYEGTGVGLAIVQRIVNRHGGRVWAEAEVERGATFYFTL